MTVALVLGAIVVMAALAWFAWKKEQARKAALQAYATAQGWTYVADDRSQVDREGTPFQHGSSRRARNVLSGELGGRPFTAFDYSYVTESGSGKDRRRTTHRFTVLCLRLPSALPTLSVTQENVLHKIGGALGFADIELESEDFNRRFRVTSSDRKFAYDVLHARTMGALLQQPEVDMRVQGNEIITWRGGRLEAEALAAQSAPPAVLVDGIPDFVWADHGRVS